MDKKTVYVLLTDTGTVLTKVIKFFTNAPYNHVSIVFDEQLDEIYSFGRKQPRNPLNAGFIREDVYFGTYRYFDDTQCLLLKMDVSTAEYHRIREVVQRFAAHSDVYSYHLLGLVGVAIGQPIRQKNKYFCSQFVADVFQKSGIDLWDLPSTLVTPHDFMMHPFFEKVYEGRLYDYPILNPEKLAIPAPDVDLPFINYLSVVKKKLPI